MPEDKKKQAENLKVESLDDLFDEPEEKEEPKKAAKMEEIKVEPVVQQEAPILPQDNSDDDELDKDLQKELEAKFDELFGPLEDND